MSLSSAFSIEHTLHELKHYLPAQAPLKDFIHHNTLHAFQSEDFHQALVKANRIFGYKTYLRFAEYQQFFAEGRISSNVLDQIIIRKCGKEQLQNVRAELFQAKDLNYTAPKVGVLRALWKEKFNVDLDVKVHPFLFRLVGNYLDQGVAIWSFPGYSNDFMKSIREFEKQSPYGIFRTSRAQRLIKTPGLKVEKLLEILVGDESLYEQYLFDLQFAHPGWSGIVSVIEDNPKTLLDAKKISLIDFIKVELLLEIDALDSIFGEIWAPISSKVAKKLPPLFNQTRIQHQDILKKIWQEAFEWTFYDQALNGIRYSAQNPDQIPSEKSLQAVLCMDDRECSLRRYIEREIPNSETFGTPGHFNLEFYFQPENGKFHTKVCPAPITPKYLIKEINSDSTKRKDFHFNKRSNSLLFGWILTHSMGFWSAIRLAISIFKPSITASTSASSMHMDPKAKLTFQYEGNKEGDLQIGYTISEMADRAEALLKSIGLVDFAPLVYFIGHGSTSVNNTHYAGYDCGACSGRPGSVNARVIASILNLTEVRSELKNRGLDIPTTTKFIGALHDTSRDELSFFDVDLLSSAELELHKSYLSRFERALDLNAKERSRRFESIDTQRKAKYVHDSVKLRSVSLFEPRPELNHATNAIAIVGRRSFSKRVFLDRRAFLNSFDYRVDPKGIYLRNILNAVAPVAGGINLEYYFSRVDNHNLGAGTKLPHNVVGLLGVSNGTEGDLRTGLPHQMIEVHDPVRLLVVVEHFPEVVMEAIQSNVATYNWFEKEWIRLVVCNPESKEFFLFHQGKFIPYQIVESHLDVRETYLDLIETKMDNLPVFNLKVG